MQCPSELFDMLYSGTLCSYCEHDIASHGGIAGHKCECGCAYFEITPAQHKALQADSQKCYDTINYRWHEINPKLMEVEIPRQLVRFASLLGSPKGRQYESSYSLWNRLSMQLRKDATHRYNSLNVGDCGVGRISGKDGRWSLAIGTVKADSIYPTLPSMMLSPGGVLYDMDGVVVANQLKQFGGVWGWPSLICGDVIPIERFPALAEEAFGDVPYRAVKDILG